MSSIKIEWKGGQFFESGTNRAQPPFS